MFDFTNNKPKAFLRMNFDAHLILAKGHFKGFESGGGNIKLDAMRKGIAPTFVPISELGTFSIYTRYGTSKKGDLH